MKKIVFVFVLLFACSGFSQIKFEPGYFIDNNGIKTECLIRNLAWRGNHETFEYILADGEIPKKASLSEVKEFTIGNSYKYRRFTTNIDMSATNISDLSTEKNPIWQEKTLFFKILVEGELTLYSFENDNKLRFFISSGKHESAEQLVFKEYLSSDTSISQNNYFRQQLFTMMNSEKLTKKSFETLNYTTRDLTSLFLKYNEAENKTFSNFHDKQNKASVNFRIKAGVNFASVTVENSNPAANFDFSKPTFSGGIEIEYVMPFNQNKWSIFIEPSYLSFKDNGIKNNNPVKVDYTFVDIPIGIRHYLFLNPKARFFIDAGYTLTLNNDSYISYGGSVGEIEKTSSYFIGGGFAWDKYSIAIRKNFDRGLFEAHSLWQAQYESVSIITGYKFL